MNTSSQSISLRQICTGFAVALVVILGSPGSSWAGGDEFKIDEAKWDDIKGWIQVKGKGQNGETVTVTNAATGAAVGSDGVDDDKWRVRENDPASVPCRVRAEQSDGRSAERNVREAPSDCDDGSGGGDPGDPGAGLPIQTDFKILMNYELGMHCTGFEFAYCCVLPVYNSILAQVVKPQSGKKTFATLLEGDPNMGRELDVLGRETVLRDPELDGNGNFKKYVLRYWHDAQPRNDGRGKVQSSTLISNVEGNSLLSWNTVADAADLNPDGTFKLSGAPVDPTNPLCIPDPSVAACPKHPLYNGAKGVVLGNGIIGDRGATFGAPIDNYQNAVWNHLYIYTDTEGHFACTAGDTSEKCYALSADPNAECDSSPGAGDGVCGINSTDANKVRLGLHIDYPTNVGPGGHTMGPGASPLENVLTYSDDTGTVVFTNMKVLENLPVMLTSPRIWEALGLPLTPFEDTIDFFNDPGLVDEDSVRPYVAMKAQLFDYHTGNAVLDSSGNEVIGFGTAPIDIPNCERCHSVPPVNDLGDPNVNSPNDNPSDWAMVQQEMNFWLAYYPSMQTNSDWYARLKGAAVSLLSRHDTEHGTGFLANYPGVECSNNPDPISDPSISCGALTVAGLPQNTRAGHESVICQKCHADNVIAVVKSASCGPGSITCADGDLIPPLTEAIHYNHRNVTEGGTIVFDDAQGRDGGCQGCHPAHRSDGDMSGYPITLEGDNFYAASDNRDANGGCFVGRDVHSNPQKDVDGAETPEYLNPVGQWLADNVANDGKGIWCTNCHQQLGQEMWKAENVADLVNGRGACSGDNTVFCADDAECMAAGAGTTCELTNVREPAEGTLAAVAAAVGTTTAQAISWLDPKTTNPTDDTHAIWAPDPGLCNYVAGYFGVIDVDPAHDGNVATVEVNVTSAGACSTGGGTGLIECSVPYPGAPDFHICGSTDVDGDFSVSLLDFCSTDDCVTAAQATLPGGSVAVPVPMSAATDGRDHWLSPGEPHCADCHAAPYVEQSGNINAFPPFNYPRKASLMRYSRGHQDITCQGCHESIHGLYPVTPDIDTTSYAQAASLNADGSHGPLKCGTCHDVNSDGVWKQADELEYKGVRIKDSFDAAVSWMHTFTDEADPRPGFCQNCHGDETDEMRKVDHGQLEWEEEWLEHANKGRVSRSIMDQAEILEVGYVAGDPAFEDPLTTVCRGCHSDESDEVSCTGGDSKEWKEHLTEGRVSYKVWEYVSESLAGSTCGW